MAYDEDLADRIRALIGGAEVVREQRMFGGLAFLIGGNMAVAVGADALLVRVDPDEIDALVTAESGADVATMGSRRMRGWVEVAASSITTDDELAPWVRRGVAFATALPAK